jgi:hypothetical protein
MLQAQPKAQPKVSLWTKLHRCALFPQWAPEYLSGCCRGRVDFEKFWTPKYFISPTKPCTGLPFSSAVHTQDDAKSKVFDALVMGLSLARCGKPINSTRVQHLIPLMPDCTAPVASLSPPPTPIAQSRCSHLHAFSIPSWFWAKLQNSAHD